MTGTDKLVSMLRAESTLGRVKEFPQMAAATLCLISQRGKAAVIYFDMISPCLRG